MFGKLAESSAPVNEQLTKENRDEMPAPATLFSKIWDQHVIADLGDGLALLHVDRHLLHDLNAMKSLQELRERGYTVRNPELTAATPDHGIATVPGRDDESNPEAKPLLQ